MTKISLVPGLVLLAFLALAAATIAAMVAWPILNLYVPPLIAAVVTVAWVRR